MYRNDAGGERSYGHRFVRSFLIAGRGPAYSGPQRRDLMLVQCASSGKGAELVGLCARRVG